MCGLLVTPQVLMVLEALGTMRADEQAIVRIIESFVILLESPTV